MVNICTYAMKATKQRLNCKADANETKSLSKLGRIFLEGTHQNKADFFDFIYDIFLYESFQ